MGEGIPLEKRSDVEMEKRGEKEWRKGQMGKRV